MCACKYFYISISSFHIVLEQNKEKVISHSCTNLFTSLLQKNLFLPMSSLNCPLMNKTRNFRLLAIRKCENGCEAQYLMHSVTVSYVTRRCWLSRRENGLRFVFFYPKRKSQHCYCAVILLLHSSFCLHAVF